MKSTINNISSEIKAFGTVGLTIGIFLISIPMILLPQGSASKHHQTVKVSNA